MAYRLIRTEDFNSYVLNDFVIDDFSDTASISNDYSDIIFPGWTARIVKQGNTKKYLLGADMQWCEMYKKSKIPDEYVEVEYIRGTGTQFINTGIEPTRTMIMELTVSDITSPSGGASLVGAKSGENTYQIFHTPYNGGRLYGRFFGTSFNAAISENLSNKLIITLDGASHSLIVKNETAGTQPITQVIPNGSGGAIDYQMFIFAMNNAGSASTLSICNIHKFVIKDTDGIKCHFIPVVRIADNKPGMYDIATKTFFTNHGTGEFIPGRYKKLPTEYQQVEWIASNGQQRIQTDNIAQSGSACELTFELTALPSDNAPLAGSYNGSNDQRCYYGIVSTTGVLGMAYRSTVWSDKTLVVGQKYNLLVDFHQSQQRMTLDDTDILVGHDSSPLVQNVKTRLFGYAARSYPIAYKLYSAKLLLDGVVQQHFVPCYIKADGEGEIGLFDIINKQFFTNTNPDTGTFTKGSDVD